MHMQQPDDATSHTETACQSNKRIAAIFTDQFRLRANRNDKRVSAILQRRDVMDFCFMQQLPVNGLCL